MTNKKNKKSSNFGCLIIILFVFIFFSLLVGVGMYNGYKKAEINYGIKKTQEKYLPKVLNYKSFTNIEAKELAMKLYLLNSCEGGQKRIDKMREFDSNAEVFSCMELLRLNISKENLPKNKTELEVLKYLNQIDFGIALENYQEFIND